MMYHLLPSIGWDKLTTKQNCMIERKESKKRLANIGPDKKKKIRKKSSKAKLNGDKWMSSSGTQMKRQMQLSLRAFSETICHSTAKAAIVNWQLVAIAIAKVSQSVSDAKRVNQNDSPIKLNDSFCFLAKMIYLIRNAGESSSYSRQ